jgi:hypothetical protein
MVENTKFKGRGPTARAVLLGAAGAFALSGAIAGGIAVPHAFADMQSQPSASASDHEITVNPTSFADVVDHVRSAVVSVKVKMNESAENEEGDGEGPQMPQLRPGDPLERFFKQFGDRNGGQFHKQKPKLTQARARGSSSHPTAMS